MELNTELLVFAGSLAAIFLLAGLARGLRLGRDPVLASEAEAARWASEVHDGFLPSRTALDADGKGALLEDASGRLMVLKPHGGHFAGRILDGTARAEDAQGKLQIISGERRFGTVTLQLENAQDWASAINALRDTCDA
jgi:hypothetical protein